MPAIVLLTPVDGEVEAEPAAEVEASPGGEPAEEVDMAGDAPSRLAGREAVIDQFGLAFSPRLLIVAAGTAVIFTNSEGALTHNVHVRSVAGASTIFNGDAASGERIEVTLDEPGGYDVLCDMHPGMSAFVFATEAPYAVAADADGSFDAGTLPPGIYRARPWTIDVGYGPEREVRVGQGPTEIDLTAGAGPP